MHNFFDHKYDDDLCSWTFHKLTQFYTSLFVNHKIYLCTLIITENDDDSSSTLSPEYIYKQKLNKKYKSLDNPKYKFTTVKTDLGPPKIFKTFTRPPLAGPYAFSRIPKPHWNKPRVHVPHEIQSTWLFLSTQAG